MQNSPRPVFLPPRLLLGSVALVISIGMALLLCEVGLRLVYPQNLAVWYKTRDNLTIHRPNHQGTFYGVETVQPYETNSYGMRDSHHDLVKREGTFRVLLLGDSFMEALQVPFDRSFPHLLETKLNESMRRPVEVINAGVSGWGTDEELTYFERYGAEFKPDLVLVAMTLHNDIYDNLEQNYHFLSEGKLIAKPIHEIPTLAYQIWQVKAYLGSHSHLYQLVRMWWHAEEMDAQGKGLSDQVAQLLMKEPNRNIEIGWELTQKLYGQLQQRCEEMRARCVVFMIPLAIQVEDARLSDFLRSHSLTREMVEIEKPQQRMQSIGNAMNLPLVDLLQDFREKTIEKGPPLYLRRDGHWTEDGHRLAASVVSEVVATTVSTPMPGTIATGAR